MLNTLGSKISCLFLIAFIAIMALFFSMHSVITTRAITDEQAHISMIGQSLARMIDSKNIDEFLKDVGFYQVFDKASFEMVHSKAKLLIAQNSVVGKINSYFYKGNLYIELITPRKERLYINDAHIEKFNTALIVACGISLAVLAMLYILISRSLAPIKQLAFHIRAWSKGELRSEFVLKRSDEIGMLANEFNKAANHIDAIMSSRQFFLRAIMHELKTPIGKARIIAALPANATNSARLDQVFARLDLLISEFGQMERVLSKYYELQLGDYHCSLVYEQALDMLMLDDCSRLCVDFVEDEIIRVDLGLFALMLKNMLDNAFKYASSAHIYVKFYANRLEICNEGPPLLGGFDEQVQAFKRGENKQGGLGLGLYLIERIVKLHGFSIRHSYSDKMHTFSVIWAENEI